MRRQSTNGAADNAITSRFLRSKRQREEETTTSAVDEQQQQSAEPVEEICSICLSDLDDGPSGTTSCGHKFHTKCLATWMVCCKAHSCPECRTYVGASGSASRMFIAEETTTPPSQTMRPTPGKRMPRFAGG